MAAQRLSHPGAATFVGREPERARLEAVIEEAVAGRGTLVLIGGEPGIGKTALVEQAMTYAESFGASVLWARCWEEEGAGPYRPWVELIRGLLGIRGEGLLDELGPSGTDLAQIVPELSIRYEGLEAAPATEPGQARLRLFDSVAAFFSRGTAGGPVVLAIDDVHAADAPTLLLLRFIAHQLRTLPVVVLVTYRVTEIGEGHTLRELLEESLPQRSTIELQGLGESHVSALVSEVAEGASSEVAAALHRKTDGNPLFVKEFLQLLESQERLGHAADLTRVEIPTAISEVIRRRFARLSEDCHRLLQVGAVIGQRFDLEVLTTSAEVGHEEALALLDEAISARLLQPSPDLRMHGFAHPLLRETLYENIGIVTRVQLHEKVGAAYESLYSQQLEPHLDELAYHFTRGITADARKAVDYSARAGRRALTRLAYEEAVLHFENALATVGSSDRNARLELLLELGDARLRAGAFEAAKEAYLDAAQLARDEHSAEALARAALGLGAGLSGFEITLRDQAQIDLLEEAQAALGKEDSLLRAWVMARLSIATAYVATPERRVDLSREAAAMAERIDDGAAKAYALSTFCDAQSGPEYVRDRLEAASEMVRLAQDAGDKEMELLGRRFRVVALMELGDRSKLHEEIDNYQRIAEFLRQPLLLWYARLFRASVALTEGRFDECERLAEEASAIAQRAQSQNAYWLIDLSLSPELRARQGRLSDARELQDPALQELKTHTGVDWPSLMRAWSGESDDVAARTELERLAANDFADMNRDGMFLPLLHFLAQTSAVVGEAASAEVLYRKLLPFGSQFAICGIGGPCYGNVSYNLALLATTLQKWDDAETHFEDAIARHASIGALPLLAHSRHEYAAMLLRRGHEADLDRARDLLREAIASYRDLGMTGWIERAQKLLEPLPEPGSVTGNVFRNEGDYWTVAYGGEVARVKDSKGVRDIARLLAEPGREFHAADLAAPGGATVAATGDVVLDDRAKAAFKQRLAELRDEIADAEAVSDAERGARLRQEFEFIQAELGSAYGLGGRARKMGDTGEKARKAVTARIKDAVTKVSAVHPSLGRHLDRSLNTGTFCSYTPETPLEWAL
ncbi:MAG: AAA family ATPase [Actinomycetota bacterium]|nr:AAA family ATPase [Actinomycetota bacterium]